MNTATRARAYLGKLPQAIGGQGGHAATFAAACRLREFALSEADAFEILSEWNLTHCAPQWSERDLRHKLADAFRTTSPRNSFATSVRGTFSKTPQKPKLTTPRIQTKPPLSNPSASFFDAVATQGLFSTLAMLRGLSVEGVKLAAERGLLRFGTYRVRLAWFVLDASGRVAQARRLDGQPWAQGVKAWTLPGSQAAWPVGIREARAFANIALCEGGPDLLAACAFMFAEGRECEIAPVAMLGGCARIHADALPLFAGKRVRMFPHVDATGESAANRWAEQLAGAGASVDAFSLDGLRRADGGTVKDLCDLAAIHAEDFEANQCLRELFDYARRD